MVTDNGRPRKKLLGRLAAGASDRVLEVVDPDVVLSHVDIDALLQRVDVDGLLDRVDVNRLLERVDVNRLMERVDVDALMERVDVPTLVDRAGIPDIVAESTSHLTGSALDLFRRPIVGLDVVIFRTLNRLFRRDPTTFPDGPADLLDWVDEHAERTEPSMTGNYAGPLSRMLAVLLDAFVVTTGYALIIAGVAFGLSFFVDGAASDSTYGLIYLAGFVIWAFAYQWAGYMVFGKTIGKMVLGLRVVNASGHLSLKGRAVSLRVISYPISFVIFGIGLLGVVFNRRRQAWHDRIAKTSVVYDWGTRTAAMPTPLADFLDRRVTEPDSG